MNHSSPVEYNTYRHSAEEAQKGARMGAGRQLKSAGNADMRSVLFMGFRDSHTHTHTHKTGQTFYASFVVCFKKLNPFLLKAKAKAKEKEVAL